VHRAAWLATAALVGVMVVAGVRQIRILGAEAGPERFPATHLCLDGAPSAWIFARRGCPHCRDHLRALQCSIATLPARERALAVSRLRLVGGAEAPAGVRLFPDSLRTALGVRVTPTTWLVGPDGGVREAWRGARNERAWGRALGFLVGKAAGR